MTTAKQLTDRAQMIMKQIESGKIKGKAKIHKARKNAAALRFRAKHKASPTKIKAPRIPKNAPKHEVASAGQGFLDNFLKQMDMVRIEELVAEKIFRSISEGGVVPVKSKKSA